MVFPGSRLWSHKTLEVEDANNIVRSKKISSSFCGGWSGKVDQLSISLFCCLVSIAPFYCVSFSDPELRWLIRSVNRSCLKTYFNCTEDHVFREIWNKNQSTTDFSTTKIPPGHFFSFPWISPLVVIRMIHGTCHMNSRPQATMWFSCFNWPSCKKVSTSSLKEKNEKLLQCLSRDFLSSILRSAVFVWRRATVAPQQLWLTATGSSPVLPRPSTNNQSSSSNIIQHHRFPLSTLPFSCKQFNPSKRGLKVWNGKREAVKEFIWP